MSRFGIRKKLKSTLKKALLGESAETTPAPSMKPPASSQPSSAKAVKPSPPPAPTPAPPKPAPKIPVAAPAAPASSASASSGEPDRSEGTSWVQAAGVKPDEVVPGTVHAVQIFGKRYALYKVEDGDFYASLDGCPHAGGPLAEGELDGFEVTCPFHSWTFDIRDGSCTSGGDMGVDCVTVKVVDEMVLLEVPL